MPYREVAGEDALTGPPEHSEHVAEARRVETFQEYVRLKSDPTLIQNQKTGEIFVRRDGRNWMHPAVAVIRKKDNTIRWEARSALADSKEYPYTAAKVA